MSEELKMKMPLFNINEEAELENELKFHLDEFTNEIMKTMSRDKDIVILKKVIEQQQKEIDFFKKEELGYMAGYEDGKRHKQTAVAIKNENAQQELFQKEIARLKEIIENQQKEIEEKNIAVNKMSKDISRQLKEIEKLNFENHMIKKWNEQLDKNCISKDKIKELKEKVEKEMISNPYDFSYMINKLLEEN